MILKCKICGGDIELNNDKGLGTCLYCGSIMTVPKVADEQRLNSFNRGNHFRRLGEFDNALSVYEDIIKADETDAEAHWCAALCRYGIEYVEDPATMEYIPTCHRASFDNFTEDIDYQAAIKYSDGVTQRQYQKDGKKIEDVQKAILATSSKEDPFDIFICYKESDENGGRTQDSVLAQDIYDQLTEKGYKVFFSRITLEEKVGSEYEPYIFAALNSAKVMIVVGTSREYLDAVWVKNEWSRFLSMMKKDRSKVLLPCYKDMNPYDMPEALSVLQSYNMAAIGFIQDLLRGISKIIVKSNKETVILSNDLLDNADKIIKRGYIALEDNEWEEAKAFFEKALNTAPENYEAYVGLLLAKIKISKFDSLSSYKQSIDGMSEYKKAIRFASNEKRARLEQIALDISNSIREVENEKNYQAAYDKFSQANSQNDYEEAARSFDSIKDYKDAVKLAQECRDKAVKITDMRKKKHRKITAAVITACFSISMICGLYFFYTRVYVPESKYKSAVQCMDTKDYQKAIAIFTELGGYKDSNARIDEIKPMYYKQMFSNANIGSVILFGSYEQDNDLSNGKEDIEWVVLEKEENRVLIISKYALDCQKYNSTYEQNITWENCSLRDWLNSIFLDNAFTSEERGLIPLVTVCAHENPYYSTSPGNNTNDRIFLLSIMEANKYFSTDSARQCQGTAYCCSKNVNKDDDGNCSWWLRSPGYISDLVAFVSYGGSVSYSGRLAQVVDGGIYAVRPALWIDL